MYITGNFQKNEKVYVGIDNGVSGSIGFIQGGLYCFSKIKTYSEQDYTKTSHKITRINVIPLMATFEYLLNICDVDIKIERPMVNPGRFKATTSALRALEATMLAIELVGGTYTFIDSKEWQRTLLNPETHGEWLKVESKRLGIKLFPQCSDIINQHGDADGILIAEYMRRMDNLKDTEEINEAV